MDKPIVTSIDFVKDSAEKTTYTLKLPYNYGTHVVDPRLYEYIDAMHRETYGVFQDEFCGAQQQFREAVISSFELARQVKHSPYQRLIDFIMENRVKLFSAPRRAGKTTILHDIHKDARQELIDSGYPQDRMILVIAKNRYLAEEIIASRTQVESFSKATTVYMNPAALEGGHFLRGKSVKFSTILIDEYSILNTDENITDKAWIEKVVRELVAFNRLAEDAVVLGLTTPRN
jgi:hypothetical protein